MPRRLRLHVLYVGSSADLDAVRRSLEGHGAVTRSRLTPEVAAVVADAAVPRDHPTLRAAASLGVQVLAPAQAIDQLTGWSSQPDRPASLSPSGAPVIAGSIVALVAVLAALAVLGALLAPDEVSQRVPLPPGVGLPVLAPGPVDAH